MATMHNFITGKDEPIPQRNPNEPTQAWADGWEAYMNGAMSEDNPFEPHSQEHHDWEDGWMAAEDN